jgi:hypothetical protein
MSFVRANAAPAHDRKWHIAAQGWRCLMSAAGESGQMGGGSAEQSRDPLAKAAYKEMVRAWLILAESAEQLVRHPPRKVGTGEQALAA